jgi:hypothetical protein
MDFSNIDKLVTVGIPATELQYERVFSNSRDASNGWNVTNSIDASNGVGRQ